MLRKIKNKKGQIGEILVVVVLIILAVLGVMKYVMPMFNKSNDLSTKASDQMSSTMSATDVKNGDVVPGSSIATVCESLRLKDSVTVTIVNAGTSSTYNIDKDHTFEQFNVAASSDEKVNESASYAVSNVTAYENGNVQTITFTKQ